MLVMFAILSIFFTPHALETPNCLLLNQTNGIVMNGLHGPTCYAQGEDDGMNASNVLIDQCAKSAPILSPGHHSKEYIDGWYDGWQIAIDASKNDDGAYGKNYNNLS